VRPELPRDELVRLQDRKHLLDARKPLDRKRGEQLSLADRADYGRLRAGRHVRVRAGLAEACDHLLDLLRRRGRGHDDEELRGAGNRHPGLRVYLR
jgi:hypothetical protein